MTDDAVDTTDRAPAEITALLGRGTAFRGKLTFDGAARIDGAFHGEIFSSGTLVIGDTAEVTAEIDVDVVIVRGGTVVGNIRARRAVELHAPGTVKGNITSPQVFIDKGVVFEGQCSMREISEPDEVGGDPMDAAAPD